MSCSACWVFMGPPCVPTDACAESAAGGHGAVSACPLLGKAAVPAVAAQRAQLPGTQPGECAPVPRACGRAGVLVLSTVIVENVENEEYGVLYSNCNQLPCIEVIFCVSSHFF